MCLLAILSLNAHTETHAHTGFVKKDILRLIEAVVSLLKLMSCIQSQNDFCQLQYQRLAQGFFQLPVVPAPSSPVSAYLELHAGGSSAGDWCGSDSCIWSTRPTPPVHGISAACQMWGCSSLLLSWYRCHEPLMFLRGRWQHLLSLCICKISVKKNI